MQSLNVTALCFMLNSNLYLRSFCNSITLFWNPLGIFTFNSLLCLLMCNSGKLMLFYSSQSICDIFLQGCKQCYVIKYMHLATIRDLGEDSSEKSIKSCFCFPVKATKATNEDLKVVLSIFHALTLSPVTKPNEQYIWRKPPKFNC